MEIDEPADIVLRELINRLSAPGVDRQVAVVQWSAWARDNYPSATDYILNIQALIILYPSSQTIMNIGKQNYVTGDRNRVDAGNIEGDGNIQANEGAFIENATSNVDSSKTELTIEQRQALDTAKELVEQQISEPSDRQKMIDAINQLEVAATKRPSSPVDTKLFETISTICRAYGPGAMGIYYTLKANEFLP